MRVRSLMYFLMPVAAAVMPAAVQATDWKVYATANGGINGNSTLSAYSEFGGVRECNGPSVTAAYCNATKPVSDTKTKADASFDLDGVAPSQYGWDYSTAHADGFALADLSTGQLKIYDHSSGINASGYSGASASFSDVLHFSSSIAGPATFGVKVHIDGTFLGYQQPNLGFTMGDLYLYQDWANASAAEPACVGSVPGCTNVAIQPANTSLNPAGRWTKLGEGDYIGTLTFDPLQPDFVVSMALSAGGPLGSWAEFEHTAGITFDLPTGMAFTSDSRTFLTAAAPSVPEPATWAMMLMGFGMVGAGVRSRRKPTVQLTYT